MLFARVLGDGTVVLGSFRAGTIRGHSIPCIYCKAFARRCGPSFASCKPCSLLRTVSAEIWSCQHGRAGSAPQQSYSGTGSAKGKACSRILLSQLSDLDQLAKVQSAGATTQQEQKIDGL